MSRAPKNIAIALLMAGMFAAVWFLMGKGGAGSCERRCMSDGRCLSSLSAEGLLPGAKPHKDRGVCNGVCSALRRIQRESSRSWKKRGLGKPPVHPCLRQRDK